MANNLADAVKRLVELSSIVAQQQAFIFAVVDYLREKPDYDPARMSTLLKEHQQKLTANTARPPMDEERLNAALLALLKAIEGPIQ